MTEDDFIPVSEDDERIAKIRNAVLSVTTAETDRRVETMRERAASFAAHHMFPPPMDHTYEMEQGILALPLTESETDHG